MGAALRVDFDPLLLRLMNPAQQLRLTHVGHHHPAAGLPRNLDHREDGGTLGQLGAPLPLGQIVGAALRLEAFLVLLADAVVLAVDEDRPADPGDLGEGVQQKAGVHGAHAVQVAGEGLEAGDPLPPHGLQLALVVGGDAPLEPKVHARAPAQVVDLLSQRPHAVDGGNRPVVVHHRGDAAHRGGHRAGGELLPVGVAGVHHVGVHVHAAGHHIGARRVDHPRRLQGAARLGQRPDLSVTDQDVRRAAGPRIDHRRISNQQFALHLVNSS